MEPSNLIAVDVDGTLYINGQVNQKLVDWLRKKKSEGFELMLWSARGKAHAQDAVNYFHLEGLFYVVISKPGYIVDDKGWSWIKWTKVVREFK